MPTDAPLLRNDRSKLELSVSAAEAAAAFDLVSNLMLHCLDMFRHSLLRVGLQPMLHPPRGRGSRCAPASDAWPTSGDSSSCTACRSSGRRCLGARCYQGTPHLRNCSTMLDILLGLWHGDVLRRGGACRFGSWDRR
jgi:hypothetical protein